MSSEIAIAVEGLNKCYRIYDKPHHRLLQMLSRGKRSYGREFWALRDISFEVRRGETVGVVGRNGSGKSTLLQLICGTLNPTSGCVKTHGRIAALLELGSGFNPEFTGRENVFMNASLLGLSPEETNQYFPDIVEFADIGDFIDQPVKTYSSGMIVRLAFAVQAQISPDILIVDEALAVGDARFQAKCFNRLNQLRERGTSILLVTHSSEQIVSHCSRAILLDAGCMIDSGEPRAIVNQYLDLLFGRGRADEESVPSEPAKSKRAVVPQDRPALSSDADLFSTRPGYNPHEYRWGDGRAQILDFYLIADNSAFPTTISSGQTINLGLCLRFATEIVAPILGITIKTKEGITVYGTNSEMLNMREFAKLGTRGSSITVEAAFRCDLAPGDYFISIGLATRDGEDVVPLDRRYDAIHLQVNSKNAFLGLVNLGLSLQSLKVAA
jgi:lipopolysaccharide transport system ATP-binding protein